MDGRAEPQRGMRNVSTQEERPWNVQRRPQGLAGRE